MLLLRALLPLALLVPQLALAGTILRPGWDPIVYRNESPDWNMFYFDVVGDTQRQVNPRTCNNLSATDISQCTGVVDRNNGYGATQSEDDCRTQFDCVDPTTGISTCAHSPWCVNSWNEEGGTILDLMSKVHRGLDPASPYKASFVIQVGDEIDPMNWCASETRADACGLDACDGNQTFQEYIDETNKIKNSYVVPTINGGVPMLLVHGNHDQVGCWESLIKPVLTAQSTFFSSATDGTNQSIATLLSFKFPVRAKVICAVGLPFGFFAATATAALPLIGCGAALPTIVTKHDGSYPFTGVAVNYWDAKPTNPTTQVVDRTGHAEVFMATYGHYLNSELTITTRAGSGNNSGADILEMKNNFQWSGSTNWTNDSALGGAPWWGIGPYDGMGGAIARCEVTPRFNRLNCKMFIPRVHKYGYFSYSSLSSAGLDPLGVTSTLDWCGRFGACP